VKELEKKGYEAIISRGITAEEIKKTTNIPVIKANESLYDLINTLHEARQLGKNINLFLYYQNPIIQSESFHNVINEIFDINLNITKYTSPKELEEKFMASMEDYEVIIGGAFVMSLCQNFNKCGVLIKTGKESLFYKIKEAITLVNLKKDESFRANQLKTILDFTFEGIISVDKSYEITLVNPIAEELFDIRSQNVIGKSVKEIIPNIKLHEVIDSGKSRLEEIQFIGNKVKVVANLTPIVVKDEVQGAIATFRDITQIQQTEKKIRLELNKKKSIAKYTLDDIIGISDGIRNCKELVKKFGKFDSNVLLYGETGTGKELFAQSIHNESQRKDAPFFGKLCSFTRKSS
jgi:PAS domain S-box-containing protein